MQNLNREDICKRNSTVMENIINENKTWSDYPMVLKPAEVVKITRLSRDIVYALLKIPVEEGGIPRIVVGHGDRKRFLIYKSALMQWLMAANEECREVAV